MVNAWDVELATWNSGRGVGLLWQASSSAAGPEKAPEALMGSVVICGPAYLSPTCSA